MQKTWVTSLTEIVINGDAGRIVSNIAVKKEKKKSGEEGGAPSLLACGRAPFAHWRSRVGGNGKIFSGSYNVISILLCPQ